MKRWYGVISHTLDDNAETVLFRIIRGTGLRGLKGIVPLRKLFHNSPIYLTRPLIGLEHQELVDFLKQEKVGYRLDKTNLDKTIMRNRIRHELLPLMTRYNRQIKQHLVNLSETAGQFDDYLSAEIDKRFDKKIPLSINIAALLTKHPLIQVALLSEIIQKLNAGRQFGYVHYQDILNLMESPPAKAVKELHLPDDIVVKRESGRLRFIRR
ncbi:MAG: hypothetical protein HY762_09380 [Planctomycetes bacterium]|nr:hypothetical protein [Planctomycetota bacterium]